GVVPGQVALGDAVVGKQHLAGVAQLEADPGRLHLLAVDLDAHCGTSRTTSEAALSRRRPWKRGWRSCRSRVHSEKPIWATSSGRTQCTSRRGRSPWSNGDSSWPISSISASRLRSVLVSKPVPTLPA